MSVCVCVCLCVCVCVCVCWLVGLQGGGRASLRCSCCTMMAAAFSSARSRALRSTRSCSCSSEAVACREMWGDLVRSGEVWGDMVSWVQLGGRRLPRHRHTHAAGPTVRAADPQAAVPASAPTAAPLAPA